MKKVVLVLALGLASPFYSFAEGTLANTGETTGQTVTAETEAVSVESGQTQAVESATSRLGQIRSSSVQIYKNIGDNTTAIVAGSTYTDLVYYIKKQAVLKGLTYYLISTKPSSTDGVIGWVKAGDLISYPNANVDKNPKTFYIKSGVAYNRAYGGKKNMVFADLSKYQLQEFTVNLTEKVGSNIWYRGVLNGKTIWLHSSHVWTGKISSTSRLAHILNGDVKIYPKTGEAITAGTDYTDQVFYIKQQLIIDGVTFYLLSTKPSSTDGVIGWVKATDLISYPNANVDKNPKTFYIKSGVAYNRAYGGKKNVVFADLSKYQLQEFTVNLTEKVGSNIWYRGVLNGQTVWIHSSHVTTGTASSTSRLGHILNSSVKIYKNIGVDETALTAGTTYTDRVFYIKKQLVVNDSTYYLLSNQPSSVDGVIGWVKTTDLVTYSHTGVDHNPKIFYIAGDGIAYNRAWGGTKNIVYQDLSGYQYQEFPVNLTEKVGSNLWYRGTLGGKTIWLHSSHLLKSKAAVSTYTAYAVSLNKMVDIQMAADPKTDKQYQLWIREDAFKAGSILNGKGTVEGDNWILRRGPGTSYLNGGTVQNGKVLTLYSSTKGSDGYTWYQVSNTSGWVTPDVSDVKYYLDYTNFVGNLKGSLQFLNLSQSANLNVAEVNEKILNGKGILAGQAQAFVDAARSYGVNEIYLISHALLETGNGLSNLANGIEVGKNSSGNSVVVTSQNRSSLTAIKKAYNMYGIGATDTCVSCGATYAYDAGWFTPEQAIVGGAAFIGNGYINKGQDTLYKMRWNPAYAAANGSAYHQYASDIGWAYKQTSTMYNLYSLLDNYLLVLDLPKYN